MKTVRPGIRKKPDGSYLVTKSIKGKRFYKEFTSLSPAVHWKNTFNPLVNPEPKEEAKMKAPIAGQSNGINLSISFGEVWKKYCENRLPKLGDSRKYRIESKIPRFAMSLMSVSMSEVSPNVMDCLIDEQKLLASKKRFNFEEELDFLKAIFNWYAENYDSSYQNPIRKFHYSRGEVKAIEKKDKSIMPHELELFFSSLNHFWQRLAYMQLYMAGRIQEAAGLQKAYVFKDQRIIKVKEVLTWIKNRPKLKLTTKTGKDSLVYINDHMMELIDELESEMLPDCPFLFHIKGKPLRYDQIYDAYNEAFERAGLPYKATHVLRYGMAGLAHDFMGDKGSQAVTRHEDLNMARKYASRPMKVLLNPDNKAVVIHAETLFYKSKVRASICDQDKVQEG